MILGRRLAATATLAALSIITTTSCHLGSQLNEPTPSVISASRSSTMLANTSICDLLTSSEMETVAGHVPTSFYGYHKTLGDTHQPTLSCTVRFYKSLPEIDITYQPQLASEVKVPGDEVPYFDTIASLEGASPFTIDSIQGRGIIFQDLRGSAALAWEYPDGNILSMHMLNHGGGAEHTDPQQRDQNVHILTALIKQVVNRVPSVATGPDNTTSFS